MFNFYSLLKALLILSAISTIILILPQKLCVPFTTNCVILTPIIAFQNLLVFVGAFFTLYAFITAVLFLMVSIIKYVISHDYFRDLFMLLITFDEKYYKKLKAHLSGKTPVRFS